MNTSPLLTLAASLLISSSALAGWTPWFDRDGPSGSGDWETTSDILKIECRFKGTNQPITTNSPAGYTCNIKSGGICKNNIPKGNKCKDMEVRFHYYNGGETPWLNRDSPSGSGDWETVNDLLKPEGRFVVGGAPVQTGNPVGYHCSMPAGGGICKNNTPAGNMCKDLEMRYQF